MNTRYFFDTEFNSFGGTLISAAMVREDGESLYLIDDTELLRLHKGALVHPWVAENVVPILYTCPADPVEAPSSEWGHLISEFIYQDDETPQIIADWPSDIADLCNLFITGPGEAVTMGHQTHFTILRHIDVYPTTLKDAVQHNAWWDAMALRQWLWDMEAK